MSGKVKEKEDLKTQLIRASKFAALGKMAGEIAHEINNPLAILMGRVEHLEMLIEDQMLDPNVVSDIASNMKKTIKRITQIISGLKSFAYNDDLIPATEFNLKPLIEETFGLCQERFRNGGINLSLEMPANEIYIKCHKTRMSQVILNLLNNAFDAIYKTQKPWVKVIVEIHSHDIRIKVQDSGRGIPSEVANKIFNSYFSTKGPEEGTGLGLSISQDILKLYGGKLYLDKKSSHTTFVILLPK